MKEISVGDNGMIYLYDDRIVITCDLNKIALVSVIGSFLSYLALFGAFKIPQAITISFIVIMLIVTWIIVIIDSKSFLNTTAKGIGVFLS
jgi:hypothetical protein